MTPPPGRSSKGSRSRAGSSAGTSLTRSTSRRTTRASSRRYPVVYLLHGYTDDESGWIQFGEINLAADRAIAEREIPPMIIVMPDGGVTFYINDAAGKVEL